MDLSAKLELLKQTPYFASLPLSEIRELVPRLLERHYRAGDLIFRKGDRSEGLCVVLSGRGRTETTSEEGRGQGLKVLGGGGARPRRRRVVSRSVTSSARAEPLPISPRLTASPSQRMPSR